MTTVEAAAAVVSDDRPRGTIHITDDAVAKLAAYIAGEVPNIGQPTRGIGRLPGGGVLGTGKANLSHRPAVSAHVDADRISVDVVASVRWPVSVPAATELLRQSLRQRLVELTGLQVDEVRVDVTDLIPASQPKARVS
jgi:uncharacterized alkaline shock family protein YloU